MTLDILYDATTLAHLSSLKDVHPGGIYRATELLGSSLMDNPNCTLSLTSRPSQLRNLFRYAEKSARFSSSDIPLVMPNGNRIRRFETSPFDFSGLEEFDAEDFKLWTNVHNEIVNLVERLRPDVFFLNWRGLDEIPPRVNCPVIVFVHDVISLDNPSWFEGDGIATHLSGLLGTIRREDSVMVTSNHVRERLRCHFPWIRESQVFVNPLAAWPRLPKTLSAKLPYRVDRILQEKTVFLSLGTLEPRKNLVRTLGAFSRLLDGSQGRNCHLLIIGSKGWLSTDIEESIRKAIASYPDSITFLGHIADSQLEQIYQRSSAMVFPSLEEGFGLPIVEAMSFGLPVITGDIGGTAEVAGDAALLVNPHSEDEILAAMSRLASDPALRELLAQKSLMRSNDFSWEKSASALVGEIDRMTATFRAERSGTRQRGTRVGFRPINGLDDLSGCALGEDLFIVCASKSGIGGENPYPIAKKVIGVGPVHRFVGRGGEKPLLEVTTATDANYQRELNAVTGTYIPPSLEKFARALFEDVKNSISKSDGVIFDQIQQDFSSLNQQAQEFILGVIASFYARARRVFFLDDWRLYTSGPHTLNEAGADDLVARILCDLSRISAFSTSLLTLSDPFIPEVVSRGDRFGELYGALLPERSRADSCAVEETLVIADYFKTISPRHRVMIDVGAHRGTSAKYFWDDDWKLFCFEPDANNRSHLLARAKNRTNVVISPFALGAKNEVEIPFYTSEESSGISSFVNFSAGHQKSGYVEMITLASVIDSQSITRVDFLKIDTEGYEFEVLKGLDFEKIRPDVIECEYEDSKTRHKHYGVRDLANFLVQKGYAVYVSEWHPIVRYGIPHQWRRLYPYGSVEIPDNSWGNLLAFRVDPGFEKLQRLFAFRTISSESGEPPERGARASESRVRVARSSKVRRSIVSTLRLRLPWLYKVLRHFRSKIQTQPLHRLKRRGLWLGLFAGCLAILAMSLYLKRLSNLPSLIQTIAMIGWFPLPVVGLIGYRKLLGGRRANRLRIERLSNRVSALEHEIEVAEKDLASVIDLQGEVGRIRSSSDGTASAVSELSLRNEMLMERLANTELSLQNLAVQLPAIDQRSWSAMERLLRIEGLNSSREGDIAGLYRLLLDRPIENSAMLSKWANSTSSIKEIRTEIMNSREFLRSHPRRSGSLTGVEPSNLVQVHASEKDLEELYQRAAKTWVHLGEVDAHWSVVSSEKYRANSIDGHMHEFWETGRNTVARLQKTLDRCGLDLNRRSRVLDYGCGVGRLTIPLSRIFDDVTGVDISSAHLELAKRYALGEGATNIKFESWSPFDWNRKCRFELAVSIISLQHSTPPLISAAVSDILSSLESGAIAVLQAVTHLPGYRFTVSDYLSNASTNELEMHAIPQHELFSIFAEHNVSLIEVLEDSSVGAISGSLSNVFVLRKH